MKRYLGLSATAAFLMCGTAQAQTTVKIGVLSGMSSLYADIGGPGSTAAAKLAVADFNATNKDVKVEIVSGDHLNKPDVGSQIANQWFDVDKVDLAAVGGTEGSGGDLVLRVVADDLGGLRGVLVEEGELAADRCGIARAEERRERDRTEHERDDVRQQQQPGDPGRAVRGVDVVHGQHHARLLYGVRTSLPTTSPAASRSKPRRASEVTR